MRPQSIQPNSKSSGFPEPVRLIFFLIGLLMLVLCFKSVGGLSTESTLKDVLGYAILLAGTAMSLSLALPPKYLMVAYLALMLILPSIVLSGYLWKFGGYWRWGIPVLVLLVSWFFVYARRKRSERVQALGDDSADFFDNADFGGSDSGGGGGD